MKYASKKLADQFAWTNDELEAITSQSDARYELTRFKGLGEMNAPLLWETTMNPETRTLIRVKIEDAVLAEKRVTTLMGDKVEPRRDWIEANVHFTLDEAGSILDTVDGEQANASDVFEKARQHENKSVVATKSAKSAGPVITNWQNGQSSDA